jgi:hypothetical protein
MIRALVFATILGVGVSAQALSCNDVPDVEQQCLLDCPDNLVSFDCGPYGVDCLCRNENGDIENTNIEAPIGCGDNDLETLCGKKCSGIQFVDDFKCKANDKADCVCAPDDGVPGRGDDASQEDLDYAYEKAEEAQRIEAELEKNPLPTPPTLVENDAGDLVVVPSVADVVSAAAPAAGPVETAEPAASSALAQTVGGSVLAMGAALLFA